MTTGMNDVGGGHAARELDASSGAFVNDTAPGVDGSVLGVNTVPATADEESGQSSRLSYTIANRVRGRGRSILLFAISGGLLALGSVLSRRLWTPRPRRFAGFALRSRRRGGLFTR
jgi:hypothetical protein